MKKIISTAALFALFLVPAQGAFAWTYDGLGSLNPFTGFRNCNKCEKVKPQKCNNKCEKVIPKCNECKKAFTTEMPYRH